MTLNYCLPYYDEPKKGESFVHNRYSFIVKDSNDIRSTAMALADDIYENLAGRTKFRFFIENESGSKILYQVDFTKETRDFFESELVDDLETLLKK